MLILGGMILDASPGADGYQNLFLLVAALSFLGLSAAYVVYRKNTARPSCRRLGVHGLNRRTKSGRHADHSQTVLTQLVRFQETQ